MLSCTCVYICVCARVCVCVYDAGRITSVVVVAFLFSLERMNIYSFIQLLIHSLAGSLIHLLFFLLYDCKGYSN